MKKPRNQKRGFERAVRVNISLPPDLCRTADEVVRRLQFNGLSDYVQARIRKDAGLELCA